MGLGLALPITSGVGVGVVTGVAQGVSEQKRVNADSANQARMLKFHLDVYVEPKFRRSRSRSVGGGTAGEVLNEGMVVLHDDKLWIERKSSRTRQPVEAGRHPFTGFYLAYPDDNRPYTRGIVSTISVNPPMLNWIYVDRETLEMKYANRSGSMPHHVGDYDWTSEDPNDSAVTLEGWEGFVAVEESDGGWAIYFDHEDDGLKRVKKGRKIVEVSLIRRLISDQEVNQWGLEQEGNIGFRSTREV
ncbi:hypothetical protein K431DRAFT_306501 [Polychaeton citri CBS 116435]|uniref:Uncharacterized protein n=1 Tax=Polychaeton citri CBS 116435 TaxID=1314669 RepID=A0A9P4Q197_9PEZI|nr:hypothetical protein K431DRAFT_306501 [Polychaeton citri CBS 116435]